MVEKKTKELLNIPKYYPIFEIMVIGNSGKKIPDKKVRLAKEIVQYNKGSVNL